MFRKTLIGLASAAVLAVSMGAAATSASAGTTIKFSFGGYNDGYFGGYYDAGYKHCFTKWKLVKIKVKHVWWDDYGYKHVSWKWKWVKKPVKVCSYNYY